MESEGIADFQISKRSGQPRSTAKSPLRMTALHGSLFGIALFLSSMCPSLAEDGVWPFPPKLKNIAEVKGGPKVGDTAWEGGHWLYREPVEIYWNDWRVILVNRVRSRDGKPASAEALIVGEGKTAGYEGRFYFDCDERNYTFKMKESSFYYGEKSKIEPIVIGRAAALVCRQ